MLTHINLKIIYTLILSVLPFFVFSQQKKDSAKSSEIETIIITGKRQKEEVIPYQKLSDKELENLNSLSVADALRYFSGVQIKDYGGIGGMKTVNIRGMGSQHVGVFYDGIQLGNAQNGTVDLGKFSLDNMQSISLYNGQKSQLLQSAKDFGSAGSIYLASRKPVFENNKKTNLNVNYRSGSFALVNPSILWEQQINNRLNTSLNFEYINSDGKYKFRETKKNNDGSTAWDITNTRKNGNINAFRAEAGLYNKLNKGRWDTKVYYYDSDRGIPGAVVKNVYSRHEKQWDRNFFIQSSFQKELSPKYKILVNAKYAYDYTRYLNRDITTKVTDITYKQNEAYLSASQQYSLFSFWDIALSTDYQYNTLGGSFSPQRNTELAALATSLRFSQFKLQASILGTFIQDRKKNISKQSISINREEYTPALFINYKPFRKTDLEIHAFYKRIFRMPTFNDLYYTDVELAVSNLKPEYTSQYDVGINYNKDFKSGILKNINAVADIYYNEVTDKILAYPRGQLFRWSMLNLDKVKIKGLDISAQSSLLFTPELLFNIKATYTYEEAQDYSDRKSAYYKDQIPYIPKHSSSLLLGLIYNTWNLNYNFIYVGERYIMSANIPANHEKEIYTSDVSLSKEIKFTSIKLKAGIEVNNLFDKQYYVIRNYPMPGRNYRISLRINL